jgi:hypothetical protein
MDDIDEWNMEIMDDGYEMMERLMKCLENIWYCMMMYVFCLMMTYWWCLKTSFIKESILQRLDWLMEFCNMRFDINSKT